MKRKCLLLWAVVLIPYMLCAQVQVIKPTVKTPTSFAIIIDAASYEKVKPAVMAYRDVIEKDNLATYILVNDWKSPEQIREQIIPLYKSSMPLEGIVLVGDIPIPMIRDAQFMSSAFKMDQRRDWQQSSIPSDRYYDDFELKFDFIKQDSLNPSYFYYSLNPESRQYINSEIYSARIRPLKREGHDKYQMLTDYLNKVVSERSKPNTLDDMMVFRGHGYNSEALDAWSGEQMSLREQLPSLFTPGNKIRFYDFEMRYPMKPYLLEQMQYPSLDVVLGHHHGAEDTQYINGYPNTSSVPLSISNIKLFLRSKLDRAKDVEKTIADYMKGYGVPREWFEMSDSLTLADSLYNAAMDIVVKDLYEVTPGARFVMFDACYNGSFHVDENIAGAYIFGKGKTIVTQGNTVNTIQDKWPDELIGLMNYGIRIGQWGRHVHFLETHIVGDPTYRFVNQGDPSLDINQAIVLHAKDNNLWVKLLKHSSPDVQALALRRLEDNGYKNMSALLKETFKTSPYGVVRMEALKLLSYKNNDDFKEVLKLAVNDNYELIRRMSMDYIGSNGDASLIPAFVCSLIEENLSNRANYYATNDLNLFDPDLIKAEMNKQFAENKALLPITADKKQMLLDRIDRYAESNRAELKDLLEKNDTERTRKQNIGTLRNYYFHYLVPGYITFAKDNTQPVDMRVSMIEALGWFRMSYQRDSIVNMCDELIKSDKNAAVVSEAKKTKARLAVR